MITEDWKNATPEQLNLWKVVSALIAYTTITPVYYVGAIGGSEFVTYAPTKLYIALDIVFDRGQTGATIGSITLYNIGNTVMRVMVESKPVWNTTTVALNYMVPTMREQNLHFSRIVASQYDYMKFNGYRLNV